MLNERGVWEDSIRFYHEPDAFTAAHLYYVPHAGIYHCGQHYEINRAGETCLDVCQILIVDSGELCVHYRGQIQTAYSGMLVLLDCSKPHRYYSTSNDVQMRWFHIEGNGCAAYVNAILEAHGFVIQTAKNSDIELCCSQIISDIQHRQENPHFTSVHIHMLLAHLASLTSKSKESHLEHVIFESAQYIEAHYADKDLTVSYLANHAALSTCYYLRKFKEFQAFTPHQFLQITRLRAARQQLITTSRSIEKIAENCGFSNTSHFVMTFRKNTGMTPLQFRAKWK